MLTTLTFPKGRPATVEVRNPLDHVQKKWVNGNYYEAQRHGLLNWMQATHPKGLRYLDIGAHIGNHMLFFLAVLEAEFVFAIEPVPESFGHMAKNMSLNSWAGDRWDCAQVALSDRNGEVRMKDINQDNSGMWRVTDDGDITVPCIRLDDMALGRADVLKMDVEHHEIEALAGAMEYIRMYRPILYIECETEEKHEEVGDILRKEDYEEFGRFNHTPTYGFQHPDNPLVT